MSDWLSRLTPQAMFPANDPLGKPNLPAHSKEWLPTDVTHAPNGSINTSLPALTDQLLAHNDGIYFGDDHAANWHRAQLAAMMPELKRDHVDTLYLECLNSTDQSVFDRYNSQGDNEAAVEAVLKQKWHYEADSFMQLIRTAHQNGIRIAGLDDREFREVPKSEAVPDALTYYNDPNGRNTELEYRNRHWALAVAQDRRNHHELDGKYVVLGGYNHTSDHVGPQKPPKSNLGKSSSVPDSHPLQMTGADYWLGIPSISFIYDNPTEPVTHTQITDQRQSGDPTADFYVRPDNP